MLGRPWRPKGASSGVRTAVLMGANLTKKTQQTPFRNRLFDLFRCEYFAAHGARFFLCELAHILDTCSVKYVSASQSGRCVFGHSFQANRAALLDFFK